MNTDKTLNETFYNNYKSEYPVWYDKRRIGRRIK